jgi:anaerobic dimethyl sulfoxide reductase subunit C (anchor subunit)
VASLKQVVWRDWSLVFFTVLTQVSVGIILSLVLLGGISGAALSYRTGLVLSNPVLLALLLTGTATLVSLLHLGSPKNAPRALGNLKGSWLSREILAIGVYSACLLLAFVRDWGAGMDRHTLDLLAVSALAGIALTWMMIKVYTIATVPAWNTWYTPFSFVSTMLSLGPLALLTLQSGGLIYFPFGASDALLYLVLAVLLTGVFSTYLHFSRLRKMDTGIARTSFSKGAYFRLYQSRMGLLAVASLLVIALLMQIGIDASSTGTWLGVLLVLILAGEILGRLLFYASYFRVGV